MARRGHDWGWTEDTTPQRVEQIIEKLNRTPEQLAAALGVTRQSVSAWRRGISLPGPAAQEKLNIIESRMRGKGLIP